MRTVKMSESTYKQYMKFLRDKKKNKKKMNKIDKILICVLLTTVLFIVAMIYLYVKFQSVPDSLVVGYFGAVFGEVSICGVIKSKIEKNKDSKAESLESEVV